MKAIRNIGFAISAIFVCLSFTSCDDDDYYDDNYGYNSLVGGVWTVTQCDQPQMNGINFRFYPDGDVTTNAVNWYDVEYSLQGSYLQLSFNGESAISGRILINYDTAIYTYYWNEVYGSWGYPGPQYTMTLRRF